MVIESWLQSSDEPNRPSLPEMMNEAARFFVPALLETNAVRPREGGSSRAAAT
jgi:hypothetical protein